MEPAPKILYGRKEAAELLSISERSLDRLVARGEIKTVSKGSRVLIHRNELDRWARKDDPRPMRRHIGRARNADGTNPQLRFA